MTLQDITQDIYKGHARLIAGSIIVTLANIVTYFAG